MLSSRLGYDYHISSQFRSRVPYIERTKQSTRKKKTPGLLRRGTPPRDDFFIFKKKKMLDARSARGGGSATEKVKLRMSIHNPVTSLHLVMLIHLKFIYQFHSNGGLSPTKRLDRARFGENIFFKKRRNFFVP